MRRALTFEATLEKPDGGLLLQLAIALRQLNINPECLAWEVFPPDGTLKVRLVLSDEDRRWFPAVADHVRDIFGVRAVKCLDAEETKPAGPRMP